MKLYRIKLNIDDFFNYNSKIVASDIKVNDSFVNFLTDKITLSLLKKEKVEHEVILDKVKKITKRIIAIKGILTGMIFFLLIIFFNQYRVKKVSFSGEYEINDEIKSTIISNTKRVFLWSFLDKDIDKISKSLREDYIEYQWISLKKIGSTIHVTINDYDTAKINEVDKTIGNVIAKKSGIISYINTYNGKSAITVNQYVKEGDILISANKLYGTNTEDLDLTSAKGLVMAYTYEEVNYEINKNNVTKVLTGETDKYKELNLFGLRIRLSKRKGFKEFDITKFVKANFFGIKIINVKEEEKCDIINTYNKDQAIAYLKEIITSNYNKSKILKKEELIKIEVLNVNETNDSYQLKMLVKKNESIGVFSKLN